MRNSIRERAKQIQRLVRTPSGGAIFGSLLIFIVLLAIWWQANTWFQNQMLLERRAQAVEETNLRGNLLSTALNRRVALLEGLVSFVKADLAGGDFSTRFAAYASGLYASTPGIVRITVAPQGIIQYSYPVEEDKALIGLELRDQVPSDLRANIQHAIESGEITLSTPQREVEGKHTLAALQAVTQEDTFWGLVHIDIDLSPILDRAGLNVPDNEFAFALRNENGNLISGSDQTFQDNPVISRIELPNEEWQLAAVPLKGWQAATQPAGLIVPIAGLMIVLLFSSVSYLSINNQRRLKQSVQQRTQEISRINQQLEQRVEVRTRELSSLLEVSHNVAATLEIQPLLAMILEQLEELVGYDEAAILGLKKGDELILLDQRSTAEPSSMRHLELQPDPSIATVIQTKKALIIPDIRADTPEARGWRQSTVHMMPGGEPEIGSWLGVPLLIKEKAIGMLVMGHKQVNFYTSRHADLALAIANQAAIAIENARLYEQAQELAAMQERQKLARELHDSVSQALYGIGLGARTARTLLDRDPAKAVEPLEYVLSLAEAGLEEMRALIFELRPESLKTEGLVAALRKHSSALHARYQIQIETSFCEEPDLPIETKQALYRVAQEALTNAVKHSQAQRLQIHLRMETHEVVLQVEDDGIGFNPQDSFPGHLGLKTMKERVEQIGGEFKIESAPGRGTRVRARLPLGDNLV